MMPLTIGVTVALESEELSVVEGNLGGAETVEVCVHLTDVLGGLQRDVPLLLSTNDVTTGEAKVQMQ